MDDRAIQGIRRHLQHAETQERIRQRMLRGRSEFTVTIGRAARLFNFTENQLRDWEERGLLKPLRSKSTSGQRQYSPSELDKLALIRELLDEGYQPGSIPLDILNMWQEAEQAADGRVQQAHAHSADRTATLSLDQRVMGADRLLFWRYFSCQALHHVLALLCEDLAGTTAALLLPKERRPLSSQPPQPEELPALGETLVGWQNRNRPFYIFLETAPEFQYPSDFRIHALQAEDEAAPLDNTLVVVSRQARPLNFSAPVVEVARRILAPLYEQSEEWCTCFGPGLRDWFYPASDFSNGIDPADLILNGLMDMIIHLGAVNALGEERWSFCCLMLPAEQAQQGLVVQAQSRRSPYRAGTTRFAPDERLIYFRAFQSRYLLYRREIAATDQTPASREMEGAVRSALAIPLGAEHEPASAVLYITSHEVDAFSASDLRVLRIMARLVQDLLSLYRTRLQITEDVREAVKRPEIVDRSFENFLSENDFVHDIETLLTFLQKQQHPVQGSARSETPGDGAISIVALDIDNQSLIARKYGERALRNLSQAIGQRIQRFLVDCRLYHIHSGRFYALLRDVPLEKARQVARELRKVLRRSYCVDALFASAEPPLLAHTGLELNDVSVSLGVTLYPYTKLSELLERYTHASASPPAEVRGLIMSDLDQALKLAQEEGGNTIIGWDPQMEDRGPHVRRFIPLTFHEQ